MEVHSRARHYPSISFWASAVLPLAIVMVFTFLTRNFQADDALIYLRYIRNVLEGNGLTYNVGENFNGLTSPLNSYLVLAASWLIGNFQRALILLSGIFMAAACIAAGRIFSRGNVEAAVTACLLASISYFYYTFGMETTLFLFLIALSLYLYRIESLWFIISLALLLITRSEGIFLAAIIALDYLWRHRRLPDLRFVLAGLVITIAPYIFNYFYYGSIVAVTGSAKIGQGQSGLWGETWIFLDFSYLQGYIEYSHVALTVFTALALVGLISEWQNRVAVIAFLFIVLLAAFYAGLNIPNYHWYYAPFIFFVLVFACRGLFYLFERMRDKRTVPVVLIFALASTGFVFSASKTISFAERTTFRDYVEIGKWLKENTPGDSSIAMVEIGIVGWYSERRIIDILGLVNDYNADYIAQRKFFGWLQHYQPDYILRHDPAWGHEQSVPPLEERGLYVPVSDFPFQNYVLLQRSDNYSREAIVAFSLEATAAKERLRELESSTETGPPMVMMEGGHLFAHAPADLSLVIKEATSELEVGFGIRETARGLHSDICFSIHRAAHSETLMNHCIDAGAPVEAMTQRKTITAPLSAGDQLLFEIDCPVTCDYGWSFWSAVNPAHDL